MNPTQLLTGGDSLSRSLALLLLLMSVASWTVIAWKVWLLRRARLDLARAIASFWQARAFDEAVQRVAAFDRLALLSPMLGLLHPHTQGTLAASAGLAQQLTRALREALHAVSRRLQFGQTLLASVGATAPFVGLLGTVWGIYLALAGIAAQGQIAVDRIAGPVGEALIMTAAGLAVAIPAVLGYNLLGRLIAQVEADLEGFAHDVRELLLGQRLPSQAADSQEP
ncbi:MAG: MotA/TolQ/ExbB proton channel family protein [Hylemonella sp.]